MTTKAFYQNLRRGFGGAIIELEENPERDKYRDIVNIYTHHRSVNAFSALLRVYQKGDCTHCRYGIVRAMNHCKVLMNEIVEECLCDSYEDTRKLAKRIKGQRDFYTKN